MSIVVTGVSALGYLVSLLGYRVAALMAVSSAGKVLLNFAVKNFGGPLNLLPDSILKMAIDNVVPSPAVILSSAGSALASATVQAAYVALPIIKTLGSETKRLLIHIYDSPIVGSLRHRAKETLLGPEQSVLVSPALKTLEIIEDYESLIQPPLQPPTRPHGVLTVEEVDPGEEEASVSLSSSSASIHPTPSPSPPRPLASSLSSSDSFDSWSSASTLASTPVVIDMETSQVAQLVESFEGEVLELSTREFQDFMRSWPSPHLASMRPGDPQAYQPPPIMEVISKPLDDDEWLSASVVLNNRSDLAQAQLMDFLSSSPYTAPSPPPSLPSSMRESDEDFHSAEGDESDLEDSV